MVLSKSQREVSEARKARRRKLKVALENQRHQIESLSSLSKRRKRISRMIMSGRKPPLRTCSTAKENKTRTCRESKPINHRKVPISKINKCIERTHKKLKAKDLPSVVL
jgi:predicted RNase H-like nuclease (RuvC/YqgF family)